MYALVLTENIISSSFLVRGLKYENIQGDPITLFDQWEDPYNFYKYDAIICKITKDIEFTDVLLNKISKASKKCPFFLIAEKKIIHLFISKFKLQIYSFPINTPIRILAFEIKRIISKNVIPKRKEILSVCDLKLDLNNREAYRFGNKFYLRNKEFHLLEFLMKNTDTVLSRQKILENVWDRNANQFTNTIDVHINTLRRKIDYNPKKRLIETIYCLGYMMHSHTFCDN